MGNKYIDRMLTLDYDGADIHFLNTFFDGNQKKLKLFAENTSKFYLDQAIKFGMSGMDYTMVKFKNEEDGN